jgi:hypothetical protein
MNKSQISGRIKIPDPDKPEALNKSQEPKTRNQEYPKSPKPYDYPGNLSLHPAPPTNAEIFRHG